MTESTENCALLHKSNAYLPLRSLTMVLIYPTFCRFHGIRMQKLQDQRNFLDLEKQYFSILLSSNLKDDT